MWEGFHWFIYRETHLPEDNITAWLFATEDGEALNFFKAFVKWCEQEGV